MDERIARRNELLAQKTIKGLESRNISAQYAPTKADALELALDLITKDASIGMGGCMSAREIGLWDALKQGDYGFIDRDLYKDQREALLKTYDADWFLTSANSLTDDGVIVNIDGNSNRVSCIAQGPRHVLFIVGMNKVCPDVDSALKRARNVAAPINAQRFDVQTPCKKLGRCMDCKSSDTICCNFLITRYSRHKDRMHLILVGESLGF